MNTIYINIDIALQCRKCKVIYKVANRYNFTKNKTRAISGVKF